MAGLILIAPSELYNLLNQETTYPCLSDPVFLLLLDARQRDDYNESHIITAKFVSKNDDSSYVVPYDADLECKTYVIIYDSNTTSLREQSPAVACAHKMWEMGSRNPVKVLQGGYEEFSALYPFLRTKKIIYMPRELDELQTYPIEIIPGLLYLGNWNHGNIPYIQKDLKIKGHINCCQEPDTFFTEGPNLQTISISDSVESELFSQFRTACDFIDAYKESKSIVLVYSKLGISRSAAVVIAYQMRDRKCKLKDAYLHVKHCCQKICPNQGFMMQLFRWEQSFGSKRNLIEQDLKIADAKQSE